MFVLQLALLLDFGCRGLLDIFVKEKGDVYDLDTLGTFVLQNYVRSIAYGKVVCLENSVLVQKMLFIFKNL